MAVTLVLLLSLLFPFSLVAQPVAPLRERSTSLNWSQALEPKVRAIQKRFDGELGIYIEDLNSNISFSHQSIERFYLASVIKIFVMIEIFKLIEEGKLTWQDRVRVDQSKYRDGAGYVNWMDVGRKITIKTLMKFMMTKSDNAATDIMISIAGLENIQATLEDLGIRDVEPLTTMLEVRRSVFRRLHPLAGSLSAMDFIEMWKVRDSKKKLKLFSRLIQKPNLLYTTSDLQKAYADYYQHGKNSTSLYSMARLLSLLARGKVINQRRSLEMVELMKRCKTGKDRIKAGLPKDWTFAHKTGTQFRTVCDMGIAFGPIGEQVVLTMCARGIRSRAQAGFTFAAITRAVMQLYSDDNGS